jgi:cold shock CspA family protein
MEANSEKRVGVVVRYLSGRGFGFLKDIDSNIEYFFHISSVPDRLIVETMRVTFKLGPGKDGRTMAFEIEKL